MDYFLSRIKRVKPADLLQIGLLLFAIVPAFLYKRLHPSFWIVSESPNEARDNGYWFFKYVREKHPELRVVYAIKRESPDYSKVVSLGETVEFGSFKHWLYYLSAEKIISSQKAMGPNAAICGFLEVYGLLKNDRYFLQHGVIGNDLKWLYYDVTKFKCFLCGAYPEYRFVSESFGYPEGIVHYTGLCRFDGLHDGTPAERLVLIMPTWREWIADEDERMLQLEGTNRVEDTEYFKAWSSFIQDERIEQYCKDYNVRFLFFPHRDMQKYLDYFPKSNEYISIAGAKEYDVQDLLKHAALMITDYSSVFFDMLYMKKPVIYYQFDYDRFRAGQYGEGYFDYRNNPFGKSFDNQNKVFEELERYLKQGFQVDQSYLDAHKEYFKLYDANNCERVFNLIKDKEEASFE